MTETMTIDAVAKAVAEELTTAFAARLGTDASAAPSDAKPAEGWTLALNVSGNSSGRVVIWIDRASAGAYARVLQQTEDAPTDAAITTALLNTVQDSVAAVLQRPALAGVAF